MCSETFRLTECELLAGVRRQREPEQRHGRDEHAGHDQVEEVVERAAADVDLEGDVHVRLGAAVVVQLVALAGNAFFIIFGSNRREKISWANFKVGFLGARGRRKSAC